MFLASTFPDDQPKGDDRKVRTPSPQGRPRKLANLVPKAKVKTERMKADDAKKAAEEVLKPLTKMQLDIWGCKYHELIMGKPHADLFIDDKGIKILYKRKYGGLGI